MPRANHTFHPRSDPAQHSPLPQAGIFKEEAIELSGYPANRLAFLRKPFKLETFAETIRELMSQWKR
jgi:hypothetical protein